VAGGYLYNIAKVVEAPQNPGLVDNCQGVAGEACYLQQVPKHRGSVEVVYSNPRYATVGFYLQATGRQFDDDLNTRTVPGESTPGLPKYAVVGLFASHTLARNFEVFLSAQNLFDQEYFVGTQPTITGAPRLVSGGIRVRLQGR
jgi:outer membrane receptor protein involved in Fe transport